MSELKCIKIDTGSSSDIDLDCSDLKISFSHPIFKTNFSCPGGASFSSHSVVLKSRANTHIRGKKGEKLQPAAFKPFNSTRLSSLDPPPAQL